MDQSPALPNRAVAFKMVAEVLHSGASLPQRDWSPHGLRRAHAAGKSARDAEMIDEMERYKDFAPLHTPIGVYIMREALELFPVCRASPFRLVLSPHHA